MAEYRRVLVTRPHVGIGSFDVNAATRPQVGLGTLQQSRSVVSFLTDDWTCRIKRWGRPPLKDISNDVQVLLKCTGRIPLNDISNDVQLLPNRKRRPPLNDISEDVQVKLKIKRRIVIDIDGLFWGKGNSTGGAGGGSDDANNSLEHLVDCLVFPQKGDRPHTDEAFRSDLDGDLYIVTWDENLIPPSKQSWPPMEFTAIEAKKFPRIARHSVSNGIHVDTSKIEATKNGKKDPRTVRDMVIYEIGRPNWIGRFVVTVMYHNHGLGCVFSTKRLGIGARLYIYEIVAKTWSACVEFISDVVEDFTFAGLVEIEEGIGNTFSFGVFDALLMKRYVEENVGSQCYGMKLGKVSLIGPELGLDTTNKVVVIKEKLKAARDRPKSLLTTGQTLNWFTCGDNENDERVLHHIATFNSWFLELSVYRSVKYRDDKKDVRKKEWHRETLEIAYGVVFFYSLIPLSRGSFDVIVGMDWLSKRKFVIVCHEKVVRIPLEGDEILWVQVRKRGEAFHTLKNNLGDAPILALPDGIENFVVYYDASNQGLEALLVWQDECEIRYHPGKANVVANALSRKERVKPRRVRAITMTIQFGVKEMILAAKSEAFKQENVLAERLHGLDQQMERKGDESLYFMD
ncbi:putative reverse transcriptase domain-containing protein [Tanacetum coccineum]